MPDRSQRWAEIERAWQAGESASVIAERQGRSAAAVRMDVAAMRKAGIDLADRRVDHSARDKRIAGLWSGGATASVIASRLDMEVKAVVSAIGRMRRRGVELEHRGQQRAQSSPVADRVCEMWRAGATSTEISAELGWPASNAASYISVLRQQGRDLPRRRPTQTP